MPELPDVATYEQDLQEHGLYRPIAATHVHDADLLEDCSVQQLGRVLKHQAFTASRRHGKLLLARIGDGHQHLVVHFGMSGTLVVDPDQPPAHSRVQIDFQDGGHLYLTSQRKLGHITLSQRPDRLLAERGIGPDAAAVSLAAFDGALGNGKATVKAALMDQSRLAGIGNVYADEICYQAGVDPRRTVGSLDRKSRKQLYGVMQKVLDTATRRQAEPQNMPETWLIRHRRDGAHDPRGDGRIERITVSGRSTYFAPERQTRANGRQHKEEHPS